jgi:hypothetical protein
MRKRRNFGKREAITDTFCSEFRVHAVREPPEGGTPNIKKAIPNFVQNYHCTFPGNEV